jgi:hypothetical protein
MGCSSVASDKNENPEHEEFKFTCLTAIIIQQ